MVIIKIFNFFVILQTFCHVSCFRNQHYTKEDIITKREEVRKIFQHAYEGYLQHASGYDELRPLTCDGINTWGSYSLTLIDALDTLAVMGNFTEFRRVVQYLVENSNFNSDINVSVFETNIRIVGGLLSAHLMLRRAGVELEPGWPCNGPLLRMAEDVARRLLPAFDTKTGMPYGTVNLRYGVPLGETPVTCTAGVGTFLVEFGTLSRLTGDPIYEEVALNAVYSLWKYRSPIGLFGNHIDVQTGRWTAQDSGIGAGVDSYFEYLVKGAVLLNRPDLLEMFHESRTAIDKYMRKEDWYVWVSMTKAQITLPVFQSLEAFWPGILSAVGDIEAATKTFAKYHSVWKQYGFLPEFYNIPNLEATANRESYPLRPEIIESAMFLYRATKDQYYLEFGDDMLTSIQHSARTECGYATVKNVRTHERENRMESFFLAETTKYLYLLFDPDNFIHNDGSQGIVFETPNGECILEAGNYIFNTEAHPIDPSALRCCHEIVTNDIFSDFNIDDFKGEVLDLQTRKYLINEREEKNKKLECPEIIPRNANITVDIEFVTEIEANFSDPEKLLSQLSKEQNKKKSENKILLDEEITEFEKDIWKELEKSLDMKNKNNLNELKHINISELTDVFKMLMKKIVLKKKISNITPIASKDDDKPINLYDLYIAQEKSKVIEMLLSDMENYCKSLSNNENKINQRDLVLILVEILELVKNNVKTFDFKEKIHHTYLLNLLKKIQNNYENNLNNILEIYTFIMKFGVEDLSSMEVLKILSSQTLYKKNTTDDKIDNFENIILKYEIFEVFTKVLELDTGIFPDLKEVKILKSILENKLLRENHGKNNVEQQEKLKKPNIMVDDDIIVADRNKLDFKEEESTGIGSAEASKIEDFSHLENSNDDLIRKRSTSSRQAIDNSKEKINEEINKKIDDSDLRLQSPVLKAYGTDSSAESPSILTEFVQSILKSTIPATPKFDPQILLEKIRSKGNYLNFVPKWELFSCKAPSFLQKIYVHGLF